MDFSRAKAQYERDGYAVVRQLLDAAEFAELTRNLDRYIRDIVPTLPDKSAFYQVKGQPETLKQLQHMGVDPFFRDYPQNPKWTALAAALIGEPVIAEYPEWFNKPPGTEHPTPPHQDNYYFNLVPPNVCTIWMALDPVDEGNGCLRYVRGSHKKPVRPHGASQILGFSQGITDFGAADVADEAPIFLQPGDITIHHGNTIHRAEPNRSPRHRRAFAIVYKGVSCGRDEEGYARYLASAKQQHQAMGLNVTT